MICSIILKGAVSNANILSTVYFKIESIFPEGAVEYVYSTIVDIMPDDVAIKTNAIIVREGAVKYGNVRCLFISDESNAFVALKDTAKYTNIASIMLMIGPIVMCIVRSYFYCCTTKMITIFTNVAVISVIAENTLINRK